MSEVTVKHLAGIVGIPVDRLMTQLKDAGIIVADGDSQLSEQEKVQLLTYLRRSHGKQDATDASGAPSRVTLQRKSVSELRQPASSPRPPGGGTRASAPAIRAKTVSVEVRKKRIYVKRPGTGEVSEAEAAPPPPPPVQAPPPPVPTRPAAPAVAPEPRRRVEPPRTRLDESRRRGELEARRAEVETRRFADQEDQERQAREDEARRRAEEEMRRQAEAEARRLAEEEAHRRAEAEAKARLAEPVVEEDLEVEEEEETAARPKARKEGAKVEPKPIKVVKPRAEATEKERSVKKAARKDSLRDRDIIVLPQADYEEEPGAAAPGGRVRRKKRLGKPQLQDKHGFQRPTMKVVREVEIPPTITVGG